MKLPERSFALHHSENVERNPSIGVIVDERVVETAVHGVVIARGKTVEARYRICEPVRRPG